MIRGSIILVLAGFVVTGAAAFYLEKIRPHSRPHHYWLLGLAALFPAWLVSFLELIEPASRQTTDVPLPPRALFSSAVGLLGVIGADYLIRRAQASGRSLPAPVCWMLGWLALAPALLIVLLSL